MNVASLLWVGAFLVYFLIWQTIFYRIFRGQTLLLATAGALILVAMAIVAFMVHSLNIELSFVPIVGVWYVMVYKKMKTSLAPNNFRRRAYGSDREQGDLR